MVAVCKPFHYTTADDDYCDDDDDDDDNNEYDLRSVELWFLYDLTSEAVRVCGITRRCVSNSQTGWWQQ